MKTRFKVLGKKQSNISGFELAKSATVNNISFEAIVILLCLFNYVCIVLYLLSYVCSGVISI